PQLIGETAVGPRNLPAMRVAGGREHTLRRIAPQRRGAGDLTANTIEKTSFDAGLRRPAPGQVIRRQNDALGEIGIDQFIHRLLLKPLYLREVQFVCPGRLVNRLRHTVTVRDRSHRPRGPKFLAYRTSRRRGISYMLSV